MSDLKESIEQKVDESVIKEKISTVSNKNDKPMSKKALKRQKRMEVIAQARLEKKKRKKMEKQSKEQPILDMNPDAILFRKEKQIAKREKFLMACQEGFQIVFDCSFDELMYERERKSLSQQIMFSYGGNRRSNKPTNMYLTGLHGQTEEYLKKISGYDSWLNIGKTSKCYTDIFQKNKLVYLTADSNNIIEELDPNMVYIIGGIVDHNRLKNITYEKAQKQGIQTAKLPLDRAINMGGHRRVLAVNHVFDLILQYGMYKDWTKASLNAVPDRKQTH